MVQPSDGQQQHGGNNPLDTVIVPYHARIESGRSEVARLQKQLDTFDTRLSRVHSSDPGLEEMTGALNKYEQLTDSILQSLDETSARLSQISTTSLDGSGADAVVNLMKALNHICDGLDENIMSMTGAQNRFEENLNEYEKTARILPPLEGLPAKRGQEVLAPRGMKYNWAEWQVTKGWMLGMTIEKPMIVWVVDSHNASLFFNQKPFSYINKYVADPKTGFGNEYTWNDSRQKVWFIAIDLANPWDNYPSGGKIYNISQPRRQQQAPQNSHNPFDTSIKPRPSVGHGSANEGSSAEGSGRDGNRSQGTGS